MNTKWVLIILLIGLFFDISKGEDKVYCKNKTNETFWEDIEYIEMDISYYNEDGIHFKTSSLNYYLDGKYNSWEIINEELLDIIEKKVKKSIEAKKETLLENGECKYWGEK